LSLKNIASAAFMNDFENYAADRFVRRDDFRTLRAFAVFDLYRMSDKSGIYRGEAGAGKFERLNAASVTQVAGKIRILTQTLGALGEFNFYYSFVPDKSLYAGRVLPGFDAEEAARLLGEVLGDLEYIDLVAALKGADFYRTDLHWDESHLSAVVGALGAAMGFTPLPQTEWQETVLGEFLGVYSGQLALPLPPDTMRLMVGQPLADVTAEYFSTQTGELEVGEIYTVEGFEGSDPYDSFLGGVQPLIVLTNAEPKAERELYIFRDSFSSSLAPLLAPYYAKITLIDLRYLNARVLSEYVDFVPGADVLFLYSSQILNNATTLLAP
jgi:hypothetical protein